MHISSTSPEANIPAERLRSILEYIERKGSAQVRELARMQSVSEATVRRDLIELERSGSVQRTHGGAVIVSRGTSYERIYQEKVGLHAEEKNRIGQAAYNYVNDGDTLFLDSGTTVYRLAQRLAGKKNLTVITYDLSIAGTIELHPSSYMIVTGGIRRADYNVLVGSATENFIRRLRVDKVFLSADAVDPVFGVSNANFVEAEIKSLLVKAGKEIILLADQSKFGGTALTKVCELSKIQRIITGSGLQQSIAKRITELGVQLETV